MDEAREGERAGAIESIELAPRFCISGRDESNSACFRTRQLGKNFRHQGKGIGEYVAIRLQNDHRQFHRLNVQVPHHFAVHRNENIEPILSPLEQFAVLNSGPANQRHRFDFVARQIAFESPIQILVEQNFQIRLARALAV